MRPFLLRKLIVKICKICNQEKDKSQFYKKNSSLDGLQSRCKECMADYLDNRNNQPNYDGQNIVCSTCSIEKSKLDFYPDRRQRNGLRPQCKQCNRNTALEREFGITYQNYELILKSQNNLCAICSSANPGGTGSFHVDHCHSSGKVRGLLCSNCNTALGLLKDSELNLLSAIDYLRKHNGKVS